MFSKIVLALSVSVFCALCGAVFNHGLHHAVRLQTQAVWLTLCLPLVLIATHWSELRLRLFVRQSESHSDAAERKYSVLSGFLIVPLTWLSHLSGASVGRESVAVQLGRSVAASIRGLSFFKRHQFADLFVVRCGAAGGFAALFGAPWAASVFALEALEVSSCDQKLSQKSAKQSSGDFFLVAACAFLSAYLAETLFGVSHLSLTAENFAFSARVLVFLICLSCVLFVVSFVYKSLSNNLSNLVRTLLVQNKVIIVAVSVLFALALLVPQAHVYKNLGTNFIGHFFSGTVELQVGDWDWLWKLMFTLTSVTLGLKGGEVTPLLSVGTLLAYSLSSFFGLSGAALAVAGYTGMFAAVFRVPLAGAVLAFESFGIQGWSGALVCLCLLLLLKLQNAALNKHPL